MMKESKSHHNSKAKIDWLKSKMTTLKMGKTQRANSFLADPASFKSEEPETEEIPANVEPWLEDYEATDPSLQQERAIRNQINSLRAAEMTPSREETSLDTGKVDSKLINKKLKKYQPANSSFSLFYGQKKGLQKLQGEGSASQQSSRISKLAFKLPVLPIKRSPQQLAAFRDSKKNKRAFFSHNSLNKSGMGYLDILSQLKSIESEGEGLINYSSRLIHRIDQETDLVDRKYETLNEKVEEMTADVGTYKLEQQINGSYKSEEYITPPRLLKK